MRPRRVRAEAVGGGFAHVVSPSLTSSQRVLSVDVERCCNFDDVLTHFFGESIVSHTEKEEHTPEKNILVVHTTNILQ